MACIAEQRQNIRASALNSRPLLIIHKPPRYRLFILLIPQKKCQQCLAQVQVLIKVVLIELAKKMFSVVITSRVCLVLADAMRGFGLLMSN